MPTASRCFRRFVIALVLLCLPVCEQGTVLATEKTPRELLTTCPRILFLGDSITYSGQYVSYFDGWLQTQDFNSPPTVINAGLPSETVSGLSEVGHAGGKFPRPDLAERLDRVLKETKPNLVIACYGINCGIYKPLDDTRFEQFQLGMKSLKSAVEHSGAKFVVMTPPTYDDKRAKLSFSYNAVLDQYSKWLLSQREHGWLVVDLHGPMQQRLEDMRMQNPAFTFQPDAVHPNAAGHWVMAAQLISFFGDKDAASMATPEEMLTAEGLSHAVLPLVQKRMSVLRDAYLSKAGHQRPGMHAGEPVPRAEQQARELTKQIEGVRNEKP